MSTSTPQHSQGLAQFTLDFVPALVVGIALEAKLFDFIEAGHSSLADLAQVSVQATPHKPG